MWPFSMFGVLLSPSETVPAAGMGNCEGHTVHVLLPYVKTARLHLGRLARSDQEPRRLVGGAMPRHPRGPPPRLTRVPSLCHPRAS